MVFAFSLVMLLPFLFIRNKEKNSTSILDKSTTKSIEGLLAIYILFSHLRQYIPYDDFGSDCLNLILVHVGQICVAPFFFFSGFGIIESIKKKGEAYSRTILINRFLRVWCWFLVALIPYYLIDIIWKHEYTTVSYVLAPFGIKSIGNSNWFVVAILICYLSVGIAFELFRKKAFKAIAFTTAIILICVVIAIILKIPSYWYDTILCFPLGMLCSYTKKSIQSILSDNIYRVFGALFLIISIIVSYLFPVFITSRGAIIHQVARCLLACLLIMVFSSRFYFKHSMFEFLGASSFAIFIFQRIPMIAFNVSEITKHKYVYWFMCIISAVLLGVLMQKVLRSLDYLFIDKIHSSISSKYTDKENSSMISDNDVPNDGYKNDSINIRAGIVINYLAFAVSIIGTFFVTKKVLFYVGDREYGLYTFVLSITSWLTVITAALNSSFIRFSMKQKQQEGTPDRTNTIYAKLFCILSAVALVLGGSIIGILYCLRVELPKYTLEESLYLYKLFAFSLINVCITIPGSSFSLFISYHKKFIFANSLNLMMSIVSFIGHFFIAYYTHRIEGIAIYTIVATIVICWVNYLFCKKELSLNFMKTTLKENKALLSTIVAFSSVVVFNVVVDQINGQVDKTILGFLGLPAAVTIYQLGHSFAMYLTTVSVAVSGPFAPSINECVAEGDDKGINDIFLKVSRVQVIIVVMVAFGFLACGREMVILWLGEGYNRVYYIGSALMILNVCPLTFNVSIEIQRARNKHLFRGVVYFIIAILNVILSLVFISILPEGYEVYGCLLGTILATICSHWVLMNWYNYKKMLLPVGKYLISLAVHMLLGTVAAVLSFVAGQLMSFIDSMLILFFLKGALFVVLYGVGVLLVDRTILLRFIPK